MPVGSCHLGQMSPGSAFAQPLLVAHSSCFGQGAVALHMHVLSINCFSCLTSIPFLVLARMRNLAFQPCCPLPSTNSRFLPASCRMPGCHGSQSAMVSPASPACCLATISCRHCQCACHNSQAWCSWACRATSCTALSQLPWREWGSWRSCSCRITACNTCQQL